MAPKGRAQRAAERRPWQLGTAQLPGRSRPTSSPMERGPFARAPSTIRAYCLKRRERLPCLQSHPVPWPESRNLTTSMPGEPEFGVKESVAASSWQRERDGWGDRCGRRGRIVEPAARDVDIPYTNRNTETEGGQMVGSSAPTVVDEAAERIALLPARRLGSMLWTRRKEAHVEALCAARAAGIEITALDDIESGRTRPAARVLAALLKCYGVTSAEFAPPRAQLVTTASDATTDEILRGYVDAVRKWRKSGRKAKLNFRANDLLALGKALGTDPDEIEQRLIAITGCSPAEARRLRKWLLAALATVPMAAVLIGGVAPTAAAATPSSANAASATTVLQGTVRPGSLSLKVADPKLGAARADGSIPLTVSYEITDARGS